MHVSILVQRQTMICDDRRQFSGVDDEEYRPEDRPLWHAADDISDCRALASATDMLSSTSEVRSKPG